MLTTPHSMRAILPLLAAASLLTFASRGLAEFDAGPAKPMQATGATFGEGRASKRPAETAVKFISDPPVPLPGIAPLSFVPQNTIKNPSNIPRPRPHPLRALEKSAGPALDWPKPSGN
jgi:hypothetical protein